MAAIKGKNTRPEMLLRKFLHANGFRYKLHDKSLPGKPDIVLPKYKTVVSVQKGSNLAQKVSERIKIEEHNYAIASRIIRDTIEAKLVKEEDPNNKSRKICGLYSFLAQNLM